MANVGSNKAQYKTSSNRAKTRSGYDPGVWRYDVKSEIDSVNLVDIGPCVYDVPLKFYQNRFANNGGVAILVNCSQQHHQQPK